MILDTNAVSALLFGDPALDSILANADRHHLPTVVIGEYRYATGCSGRGSAAGSSSRSTP